GGADRVELVTAMEEGGLTPDNSLIREAVQAAAIPVHVMIRPHSRSFRYDEADVRSMLAAIEGAQACSAAGVVLGALNAAGGVDVPLMHRLLAAAGGLSVTFHRAI